MDWLVREKLEATPSDPAYREGKCVRSATDAAVSCSNARLRGKHHDDNEQQSPDVFCILRAVHLAIDAFDVRISDW